MPVQIISTPQRVTALLSGDIDHHNSAVIRDAIDEAIRKQQPEVLTLDFNNVIFMDSSGVGLVMGRYQTAKNYGGRVIIKNLSPQYYRIMKLSGIEYIAKIYLKEEEKK